MICFYLINGFVDEIHMGLCMGHFEFLIFQDVISVYSVHDFVFGSLYPAVDHGTALFFVEGFTGKKVVHDARSGKPERVCQNTVDSDAGNRHAVLIAVLLCSAHIRKLQAVAGQLTQSPVVCGRNKRSFDNVGAKQVGNPFRITLVRFLAFDGFHIFGMCEDGMHVRFKNIKNRNPVFTRGFHADIVAVLCLRTYGFCHLK